MNTSPANSTAVAVDRYRREERQAGGVRADVDGVEEPDVAVAGEAVRDLGELDVGDVLPRLQGLTRGGTLGAVEGEKVVDRLDVGRAVVGRLAGDEAERDRRRLGERADSVPVGFQVGQQRVDVADARLVHPWTSVARGPRLGNNSLLHMGFDRNSQVTLSISVAVRLVLPRDAQDVA
jgi:hypothetical protein